MFLYYFHSIFFNKRPLQIFLNTLAVVTRMNNRPKKRSTIAVVNINVCLKIDICLWDKFDEQMLSMNFNKQ